MEPAAGFDHLKQVVEESGAAIGMPIEWSTGGGASDGNNISALGIPTIDGMGPSGSGAHGSDENMMISSFFKKTVLLTAVLQRLIG